MPHGQDATNYPDGIDERHALRKSPLRRNFAWWPLVLIGTLLAVAFSGMFGGHPNPTLMADGERGELQVNTPHIMRSGEFFEMRFRVRASQPIAKPVLAISHSYLRDLTLNTFKPSPAKETSDGTFYRMEFDALDAGDTFEVMIDGQVNPDLFGGTKGSIELLDDETPIVRLPLELEIRP